MSRKASNDRGPAVKAGKPPAPATPPVPGFEETIDLSGLFSTDVTSSGSFDLKDFRLTTLGKFLDVLPMPALLVEGSGAMVFLNHACRKFTLDYETATGIHFARLFPNPLDAPRVTSWLEKVSSHKIPLVVEAAMGIDCGIIRGRLHIKPVRLKKARLLLVVIEDITPAETV